MTSAETSRIPGAGPTAGPDLGTYVSAVDDLLLDVPWRRRRELIADLREHLREHPDQLTAEPPEEYAAELRAAAGATPGGLLAGLRSPAWPTPVEWCESVVRAAALLLVVRVLYELVVTASSPGAALLEVYPVPPFGGSTRNGVLIFTPLTILTGQLITAAVLRRAPHRRPALRRLTYAGIVVIALLLGYGALRSFG